MGPRRVAAIPRRLDAVDACESTHAVSRTASFGGGDVRHAVAASRWGKSDYTKVKGEEGIGSRRPERLLRAPRLALQVLQFLSVARRVARVFRGHRAPLVATMTGVRPATSRRFRWIYYKSLYADDDATLADLREAVTTLADAERTVRRVFGGTHPLTVDIEDELRDARAALNAREPPQS